MIPLGAKRRLAQVVSKAATRSGRTSLQRWSKFARDRHRVQAGPARFARKVKVGRLTRGIASKFVRTGKRGRSFFRPGFPAAATVAAEALALKTGRTTAPLRPQPYTPTLASRNVAPAPDRTLPYVPPLIPSMLPQTVEHVAPEMAAALARRETPGAAESAAEGAAPAGGMGLLVPIGLGVLALFVLPKLMRSRARR